MVQGSNQDGQMCENHSWVTYSYDEHVWIFSSEPHCTRNWNTNVNKPRPLSLEWGHGKNWVSACYPQGAFLGRRWSLWDSIQLEKNITTGVYRQWHRWLNHPGSTAANMLEESLREPETRSGGFTYLGKGGGGKGKGRKRGQGECPKLGQSPGLGETSLLTPWHPKARAHAADAGHWHLDDCLCYFWTLSGQVTTL